MGFCFCCLLFLSATSFSKQQTKTNVILFKLPTLHVLEYTLVFAQTEAGWKDSTALVIIALKTCAWDFFRFIAKKIPGIGKIWKASRYLYYRVSFFV